MAILPGKRLGPYEILSSVGAGGMGEVYRARDTRLNRIVAIKVLPAHLADRSELRERFEREARTIASLNHPHICTLHDIGQQDGIDYLVMEYVEGETLAHRLLKGPVPLDLILQYAIEIADALDKAHRKGVTHRDLKPGNIMLTKTGTKLLDFGLAKLKQEVAPANMQLSQLPTANDPLTAQGTIVGTLQYMAPEQLEGKEVDARTDIFAFSTVVYEMATGKRAFEGKSQASLIAAILEREPPAMSSLQPMTPPALDRVVKKCLAKEPEKRWQAASDVCDELKWIAEGGSQITSAPTATGKGIREAAGASSRRGRADASFDRELSHLESEALAAATCRAYCDNAAGRPCTVGFRKRHSCCRFSRRHPTRVCRDPRGDPAALSADDG
jgi:serine/threonine protein kinase